MSADGSLAVTAPDAVDQEVAGEEDPAPGEHPDNDPAVTGCHPGRLLHEIERDRADQHARAEAHDETDHPQTRAHKDREDRADHERRGCEGPPAERLCHLVLHLRGHMIGPSVRAPYMLERRFIRYRSQ